MKIRIMDGLPNKNGHTYSRECILKMSAKLPGLHVLSAEPLAQDEGDLSLLVGVVSEVHVDLNSVVDVEVRWLNGEDPPLGKFLTPTSTAESGAMVNGIIGSVDIQHLTVSESSAFACATEVTA